MRRRVLADLVGEDEIVAGSVRVDGRVITNPRSLVAPGSSIVVVADRPLRGTIKLEAALNRFVVPVAGRVALDVGAATGGFTTALLEAGAQRVYAVDVGHGQLLGSLRQDSRVVNLEMTNVADLGPDLVPEAIDIVTIDVSYLSLAEAAPQLDRVQLAAGVDLIGLVKPMFELALDRLPDPARLDEAMARAVSGVEAAGWRVAGTMPSPIEGARGATEFLLHATR